LIEVLMHRKGNYLSTRFEKKIYNSKFTWLNMKLSMKNEKKIVMRFWLPTSLESNVNICFYKK